ncbi:MAG: hypothetical protein Fur002_07340 [Anaerolineales bacterium]
MKKNSRFFLPAAILSLGILTCASGCSPATAPAPFRPPTQSASLAAPALPSPAPPALSVPTSTQTAAPLPVEAGECANDLIFLADVTIEDNEIVLPNSTLDKRWLVQNAGSCNWDETYRLKWLGGDPLGAAQEQPLFPARAGAQATLRILFLAPGEPGTYESSWQAVDPHGNLFGDPIYIKFAVGE